MAKKGKKFYSETENGGVILHTERRIGDVRIPNYVYDMWLPLLGAVTIGVYGMYCRLERGGAVKGITLKKIARKCRLGKAKLEKINGTLEECGFVSIRKPEGFNRLRHYTTEITVLDPPQEIRKELIEVHAPSFGYEILTPWLMGNEPKTHIESPEHPNGSSEEPKQVLVETPDGSSKIASFILQFDDDDGPARAAASLSPLILEGNQVEAYCCLRCESIEMDSDQALKLAQACDLEAVRGWCCVAWARHGPGGVTKPAGFVWVKLTKGVAAPDVAPAQMREFMECVDDYRLCRLLQEAGRGGTCITAL